MSEPDVHGKGELVRYASDYSNAPFCLRAEGCSIKSSRGTQFRQRATTHLKEYLVKGFVMDDARLKDPANRAYFHELRRRIREVRASEGRFEQKVRELFAQSVDYKDDTQAAGQFFAEVQNKMFYAVTQQTAAEIVIQRADGGEPNMALSNWKAGRVRKSDVIVAKNYLHAEEIDHLNRIVTLFLDFAELRAEKRKDLRMADWRAYVDAFIEFSESPLLKRTGRTSRETMVKIVHERYEEFDAKRRGAEALSAGNQDIKELEIAERELARQKGDRDAS